jgi:hypothetical protein
MSAIATVSLPPESLTAASLPHIDYARELSQRPGPGILRGSAIAQRLGAPPSVER